MGNFPQLATTARVLNARDLSSGLCLVLGFVSVQSQGDVDAMLRSERALLGAQALKAEIVGNYGMAPSPAVQVRPSQPVEFMVIGLTAKLW